MTAVPSAPPRHLLDVAGLDVTFPSPAGPVRAVRGLGLTLDPGRCLALVGESGSGKSVTARTLVGLAGQRAEIAAERLAFDGTDLRTLSERQWRRIRGRDVGLVLQDALVSLDPLRTVGGEVGEALREHGTVARGELQDRVEALLTDVGIPDPARRARQHSHELSGGLRQRALIASALAAGPRVVVADEPTTALDVTVQAQILDLLEGLKRSGTALLLISHDLAVVARLADEVAVMYAGRVVEHGPARSVLHDPQHPYTQALVAAVPRVDGARPLAHSRVAAFPAPGPDGCPYAARCVRADEECRSAFPLEGRVSTGEAGHVAHCRHPGPVAVAGELSGIADDGQTRAPASDSEDSPLIDVRAISKSYRTPDGGRHDALSDVSFHIRRGETLGLVGESGSGKTSAARVVLGLLPPDGGQVLFAGTPWSGRPERERRRLRSRIQAVPQDPLGSFDPRHTVGTILGEALAAAGERRVPDRRARSAALLEQVGLEATVLRRRPRELSGGQRQRVAIARALASGPDLLVCDEPVSALDVSIQAQILDLLVDLRARLGLAMLFISHDLGVIRQVSDRVAVMKDGRIVETGQAGALFSAPEHAYTRELLAAVPRVEVLGS